MGALAFICLFWDAAAATAEVATSTLAVAAWNVEQL